jgi:hypothetical protein
MPKERSRTFFNQLKTLIEGWCDRRAVKPLAVLLPAYVAFDGQSDGWKGLLGALKRIQLVPDEVSKLEIVLIAALVRDAERAVYR